MCALGRKLPGRAGERTQTETKLSHGVREICFNLGATSARDCLATTNLPQWYIKMIID